MVLIPVTMFAILHVAKFTRRVIDVSFVTTSFHIDLWYSHYHSVLKIKIECFINDTTSVTIFILVTCNKNAIFVGIFC